MGWCGHFFFLQRKIAFDLRKGKKCSGKIPIRYFFATDSRFVAPSCCGFLCWTYRQPGPTTLVFLHEKIVEELDEDAWRRRQEKLKMQQVHCHLHVLKSEQVVYDSKNFLADLFPKLVLQQHYRTPKLLLSHLPPQQKNNLPNSLFFLLVSFSFFFVASQDWQVAVRPVEPWTTKSCALRAALRAALQNCRDGTRGFALRWRRHVSVTSWRWGKCWYTKDGYDMIYMIEVMNAVQAAVSFLIL